MAVYTVLNEHDIETILKHYDLGILLKFSAISSGIENTNYFVWTEKTRQAIEDAGLLNKQTTTMTEEWVLTIFENIDTTTLPFFNQLTTYLQKQGLCVPAPMMTKQGRSVFSLSKQGLLKKGVIVPKFKGKYIDCPDVSHCRKIAVYLANMHVLLSHCTLQREIEHSWSWCHDLADRLMSYVSEEDQGLLTMALERYANYQEQIQRCALGVVHGDLFRDNVLFEGNSISGVIDFYHAGNTAFLFDLAVVANDWAVNFDGLPALFSEGRITHNAHVDLSTVYDQHKLDALLASYASVKPLSTIEKATWPSLLELAAFRFWLSRLKTKYLEGYQKNVQQGEVVKSPELMKIILLAAMKKT